MSLALPPLGLGCAPLAGLYTPVDEETAQATVGAAWDQGIRYFDTAPHYGLGLSERRLGRALRGRPRDAYVVSTKVGRILEPVAAGSEPDRDDAFAVPAAYERRWDFSADGVRRSLDESLARLGLDRVDVVYVHDPDEHMKAALTQALPALARLRAQGVVRAIGVGMNSAAALNRFVAEADIDVVLLAGRYTLLEQAALDDLLPRCVERDVAVVVGGVFNSGLLAYARPPDDVTYNYAAAPQDLLARARRIAEVCERYGVTLPQAALQFPAAHPAVRCVLVGARSPEEVDTDAALARAPVPRELWPDLVREGLLDPRAPLP